MKNSKSQVIYSITKKAIDFAVSFLVLIIISPLFIVIGVLIKLDSKGSIFIKQERVGLKGKKFIIYKFRTMHKKVGLYEISPTKRFDKRVTKFGKFLRRFSLDELPQFFNVLKGNMSLVGPRPEMLFIVKKYSQKEIKRLSIKPGITGLWQIKAPKNVPLYKNMQYDFEYIEKQSLLFDLKIILKTITVLIRGKNLY